jgi:uncharacterized membrane protein YheB (UPF0754 family)
MNKDEWKVYDTRELELWLKLRNKTIEDLETASEEVLNQLDFDMMIADEENQKYLEN